MPRRPKPMTQFSLNLNTALPAVEVPDEVVQVLADLLLEAVGARSGAEPGEDGREPKDYL